jgi:Zn finger protein HypA/HybF involved in hydrogenase expression
MNSEGHNLTQLASTIDEMRLDGNAIGGLLREIFAMEMTSSVGTCAHCGAVNELGRVQVYVHAPGTVVRCPACEAVLMRVVRGRGRYWLDMSGVRCLEFAEEA